MISRRWQRSDETAEEMRARMLTETSVYLTECLRHPELAVRIPIIRVGHGTFPPSLTVAFWEPVLND